MVNIMIDKNTFVKTLDGLKYVMDFNADLNHFFRTRNCDTQIVMPDCTDITINLLHEIFGEKDNNEWISYFCFELDFGREHLEIKDMNGNDIDLSTPEKLYDFLMED